RLQIESNPQVLPIKIHSLERVRKTEFWPKYIDPRNPSAPVEQPYCPEAQTDWEELAMWVQKKPRQAQNHIVRITEVNVGIPTNKEEQGYRERKWRGAVLIKREKHNETGIVYDPQDELWYITTGLIKDQNDVFVLQARFVSFSETTGAVLRNVLDTGNFGNHFTLQHNYQVVGPAGSIQPLGK
ncbi:TPA: hypothetical protein DIV55_02520, partial [Patescibacteria group bacterium]|nr:hypothetical protein [Patescibacteria group bacterium]